MNITGLRDWGRLGPGGHNAEGNALYYKSLTNSAQLAKWLNKTDQAEAWEANATLFKQTYNDAFWLGSIGMYRDNASTTLAPQDANSMAILFNLTTSAEQANSVSAGLTQYWSEYGSVAPELPDNVRYAACFGGVGSWGNLNKLSARSSVVSSCRHTSRPGTMITPWTCCVCNGGKLKLRYIARSIEF